MGTIERLEILRDKIKCPQFGDNEYGEWGALKLEQREAIKSLIDSNKNKDNTINDLLKRISNIEFEIEERDRRIDTAVEYNKEVLTWHTNEEITDEIANENIRLLKGKDNEWVLQ